MSVHSCTYMRIEYPQGCPLHGAYDADIFLLLKEINRLTLCSPQARHMINLPLIRGRLHICYKGGKYKTFALDVPLFITNAMCFYF